MSVSNEGVVESSKPHDGTRSRRAKWTVTAVGLIVSVFGAVAVFFTLSSLAARVMALLICAALTLLFLRAVDLWQDRRLDLQLTIYTGLTVALLLVPLMFHQDKAQIDVDMGAVNSSMRNYPAPGVTQSAAAPSSPVSDSSFSATTSASPTPSSAASAQVGSPPIHYQGVLALDGSCCGSKDLDLNPPADPGQERGGDFSTRGFAIKAIGDATVALWRERRLPSYSDCAQMVTAAGVSQLNVGMASVVCVRTDEGRVGRLKVIDLDGGDGDVTTDAVIWGPVARGPRAG